MGKGNFTVASRMCSTFKTTQVLGKPIATQIEKLRSTGKTHQTDTRNGASRSEDGSVGVKLSMPGSAGASTKPAQIVATR